MTSAWATSSFKISRPSAFVRSNVMDCLLRASARKRAPTSSPVALSLNMYSRRPNGVSFRRGSPPGGSTMMTSAPSSAKSDEHQWPMIIIVVQSRTRMLVSASGFSKEYALVLEGKPRQSKKFQKTEGLSNTQELHHNTRNVKRHRSPSP